MASRVVSLRLKDEAVVKLERQARRLQRTPGETAVLLLTEKLREEEFPFIEFRPTAAGRLAFVEGSRLSVWMAAAMARDFAMDGRRLAEHLQMPVEKITAALSYAQAYPEEIDPLVQELDETTAETLSRMLPGGAEIKV